jgi:hypothetical protein
MAQSKISKAQIIAALAGLTEDEILEVGQEVLAQLPWGDVGGQGVLACALGPQVLVTFNHTTNFGVPTKTNGKTAKYPRVASTLGFKGVAGSTLGVTFTLNAIDTALLTTQVAEPVSGTEE